MNPFEISPIDIDYAFMNWKEIYPCSYDKNDVNPYTKARIILMNGTEVEQAFFLHQFSRNCNNNDLRRELALMRRQEQQQQKMIQCLKPIDENMLETTISYELLAVDLTSRLAKNEPDPNVKMALDFALLEDFDHLYRYSNLLEDEYGIKAEELVGGYAEIMPGRPTISEHRYPFDSIKKYINKDSELITKLNANIITAAEQQTMNYYMNICNLYPSEQGRKLYQEIAMIEEEHVSHYGSLIDPNMTWLENLLFHQYTECYLYYSCMQDETHPYIKQIWEQCFYMEVGHLQKAAELLRKYENKDWCCVIPNGTFPKLLTLGPNIEYVREVLKNTVTCTACLEGYMDVSDLPSNYNFFKYQQIVNGDVSTVPSHRIIEDYIKKHQMDYRYQVAEHPIPELRDRRVDNTTLGRVK